MSQLVQQDTSAGTDDDLEPWDEAWLREEFERWCAKCYDDDVNELLREAADDPQ